MAWTSPRTYVTGEVITASILNTDHRDNLLAIDAIIGVAAGLTDGAVLLGSGTGTITALAMATKGDLLVGDGTTDPRVLGVGVNGRTIVADSAETTGMRWGADSFVNHILYG